MNSVRLRKAVRILLMMIVAALFTAAAMRWISASDSATELNFRSFFRVMAVFFIICLLSWLVVHAPRRKREEKGVFIIDGTEREGASISGFIAENAEQVDRLDEDAAQALREQKKRRGR